MRYVILIFILFEFIPNLYSQVIYVDPTVTAAMVANTNMTKGEFEKQKSTMDKVAQYQLLLNEQMRQANELQNKIYKGLTEVSSIVSDAYMVQDILHNITETTKKTSEITSFISRNPEYSVFGIKITGEIKRRCIMLTTETTQILTGGELNMMNSAQRRTFLLKIRSETSVIFGLSYHLLYTLNRAKTIGFWKSINPFSTWYNTDKRIADNIIKRSKFLF